QARERSGRLLLQQRKRLQQVLSAAQAIELAEVGDLELARDRLAALDLALAQAGARRRQIGEGIGIEAVGDRADPRDTGMACTERTFERRRVQDDLCR